jgi:hypothetical protein
MESMGGAPVDKECFRNIAEGAGLDPDPRHIDDLYAYWKGLEPILRTVDGIDLTGLEPCLPNPMKKE